MFSLRYYAWLCCTNLGQCLCRRGERKDDQFSFRREGTDGVTNEQYSINDEQMTMIRDPNNNLDKAGAVSPRVRSRAGSQAENQNKHFTMQFDAHSTRLFQEAVARNHKVHKAAKHGAKDLEKLTQQLEYLHRRLYGLRLAATYHLSDDSDMLQLAQTDIQRVSARIDEIEEIREKLEKTLTAMYKPFHEGLYPLFHSLGVILSKQGLMPKKFNPIDGSVTSTASIHSKSHPRSKPASPVTNPYSSPTRSNDDASAMEQPHTLRRKSAVSRLQLIPNAATEKSAMEVPDPSIVEKDYNETLVAEHDAPDTPKTVVVNGTPSIKSFPSQGSIIARGVLDSPECRAAVSDVLKATNAFREAEESFDAWEEMRAGYSGLREVVAAAGTVVSSQTEFDRSMLRYWATKTRALESAERDLKETMERAVKEFGVVFADAESGFGGTWTGDGYAEDLVDNEKQDRRPLALDNSRVERWIEGVWDWVSADDDEVSNPPAMEHWDLAEIDLGESYSCMADGDYRRRIDKWRQKLGDEGIWRYRRASSLSVI